MRKLVPTAAASLVFVTVASAGMAAESAGPAFMPFDRFVSGLTVARPEAYAGRAAAATSAFGEMRRYLLDRYQGVTSTHGYVLGGQTFDCIPIDQQPGLRGQGPRAAAAPPPSPPAGPANLGDATSGDAAAQAGDGGPSCEEGTVPVRRVTLDELTRFPTLQQFFQKGPGKAGRPRAADEPDQPPSDHGHVYAHAFQFVKNYGGYSFLNVWRPSVNTSRDQIFSLSQQWYTAGSGSGLQTAEVGWQVYPRKYGTESPVLFVFWTPNDYRAGCYNLDCGAFVQTNRGVHIGAPVGRYSVAGGKQAELGVGYYFHGGNWWLAAGNSWVGYYPGRLYGNGPLSRYAQVVDFGGETAGLGDWPPMGSGQFAAKGYRHAAYQRDIVYRDASNGGHDTTLRAQITSPGCYTDAHPAAGGSGWRTYFFFGGPGGDRC